MGLGFGLKAKADVIAGKLLPYLPRQFSLSPPVCQLYLHESFRSTRFTLLDFPAVFSPSESNRYYYEVAAYRRDGTLAGRDEVDLQGRGTREFGVGDTSFSKRLDEWGLFTAQLRPRTRFGYKDHHLGRLTSQFYALYHSLDWQSLALVHPQVTLGLGSAPAMRWSSGQRINTSNLSTIEVFQINPTNLDVSSKLLLNDSYGNSYAGSSDSVPALGTRRLTWSTLALPKDRLLHLSAEGMTCANAKPVVFCHFLDGSFNGGHS